MMTMPNRLTRSTAPVVAGPLVAALLLALTACTGWTAEASDGVTSDTEDVSMTNEDTGSTGADDAPTGDAAPGSDVRELATFGAGCFWCVEAVLEQLDGVLDVQSGYMGGESSKPTYQEVCSGTSGHAEVVHVTFDPGLIAYDELLAWFWKLHDPTTLNRQGADVGTQYRSAIFAHGDAQASAAEASKTAAQLSFRDPIVTEITPASTFYAAEAYHQDYYRQNRAAGYCQVVIAPKLDKLGLEK